MANEPKNIWKKPLKMPGGFWGWLIAITALTFLILLLGFMVLDQGRWRTDWPIAAAATTIVALILSLLFLVRWLCCWRNLKRFIFGLACVFTLAALFYAEEDWRGLRTWNRFKQPWEARGVAFDMRGLTPPPAPDDQNFAMTPIVFTSYGWCLTRAGKQIPQAERDTNFIQRMEIQITGTYRDQTNGEGDRVRGIFSNLEGWQNYYRDLARITNQFPVPAQRGTPAADVLLALSKYDGVIEELRSASQLPASRFPLEYDKVSPVSILLPHLAPLKGCAMVLGLRTVAELQNGQPDKALEDARLGLKLAGTIRTEPFLISHLVRVAIVQIMLEAVWEGLAQHKWSDPQLSALDACLAGFDFPADYERSMRGEMAMQMGEADFLRRNPEELENIGNIGYGDDNRDELPLPGGLLARLIPDGWFHQNQYRCARIMLNYYIPADDVAKGTLSPELPRLGDAAVAAELKSPSIFNRLERLLLPALGNAAKRFAYGQASVDMARTAIALERYRLAHGEFPESLDALAPLFAAKAPHDVIDGKPLKYRRVADGQFLLYSIGWNETDDGGVVVFKHRDDFHSQSKTSVDLNEGDWVWQIPRK